MSAACRPSWSSAQNNMSELRVIQADRTSRRQLARDRRVQARRKGHRRRRSAGPPGHAGEAARSSAAVNAHVALFHRPPDLRLGPGDPHDACSGCSSIRSLPIAQFPALAPPQISVSAIFPGADATTLDKTTTQIIEQQLQGIDHLRYFSSQSSSSGQVTVTLTFEQGTNPDTAQVQVNNKVQAALPLLPQEVQRQGVRVEKSSANFALVPGLYSADGSHEPGRPRRHDGVEDPGADQPASTASAASRCSARNMRCASGSIR